MGRSYSPGSPIGSWRSRRLTPRKRFASLELEDSGRALRSLLRFHLPLDSVDPLQRYRTVTAVTLFFPCMIVERALRENRPVFAS